MPIVQADRLTRIGAALLKAAGASDEEAQAVASGCVNANLAGHDSHGVIAIPTYIDRIAAGHIVPGAKWTIAQESPTTTVIDGHWGFGFHVNAKAMELTIAKAKTANVAACTVFRQSHVGRLAHYPMMAMREGMIGIATADSGRSPKHVAPFGGREARLGTNPISIAVPSDLEAPFYLDMATSAVAAGKIALAVARKEEIPAGWIIDAEGRIVAGHGRAAACKLLKLTRVPVIEVSHLNETQLRAYALADNRIAEGAGWDSELLAIELKALQPVLADMDRA